MVVEPGGDIVNIITQSAMLRLIADRLPEIGDLGRKPISDLGLGGGHVFTVGSTEPAIAAFRMMKEHVRARARRAWVRPRRARGACVCAAGVDGDRAPLCAPPGTTVPPPLTFGVSRTPRARST